MNVSSIGVQTNPPRFSAYVASKAALDAWTRVVASEVVGDGVTFTTIHMPLVRTPMIEPTKLYDAFPAISAEQAADMVGEALSAKPKRIDTRLGTIGEVSYAVAPKAVDQIMHAAYRVLPDSAAARGEQDPAPNDRGPGRPGPSASLLLECRAATDAGRLKLRRSYSERRDAVNTSRAARPCICRHRVDKSDEGPGPRTGRRSLVGRLLGGPRGVPDHQLAVDRARLEAGHATLPRPVRAQIPGVAVVGEAALQRVEQIVAEHRVLDGHDELDAGVEVARLRGIRSAEPISTRQSSPAGRRRSASARGIARRWRRPRCSPRRPPRPASGSRCAGVDLDRHPAIDAR